MGVGQRISPRDHGVVAGNASARLHNGANHRVPVGRERGAAACWKIGNGHIFEPVVSRKEVHHRLIDDLLSLFGGSPRPLMAHLLETGRLTLEDLRSLERSLGEQQDVKAHSQPTRHAVRSDGRRRKSNRHGS